MVTAGEAEQEGRRAEGQKQLPYTNLRPQPEPEAEPTRCCLTMDSSAHPLCMGEKPMGTELKGTNASNRWVY